MELRIGYGIDFHKLVADLPLMIGGIEVPHYKGSLGHSDADVLLHAICDAMLGALGLGDIGMHFPDTDPKYKGIDSKLLLKECYELIQSKGFRINNLDSTVCLQKPKLRPHIDTMKQCIADLLKIDISLVSVKATTTEQMGFVGDESGIEAHCTILLIKD